MKKIVVNFTSSDKVQKVKNIMKKVHSKNDNQIKDISKFSLGRVINPESICRAEIEILDKNGGLLDSINVPKQFMTFLFGKTTPFQLINSSYDVEGEYIVLPWNIETLEGRDHLRDVITKISSKSKSLKYTIYVETQEDADNISIGELSLSGMSFSAEIEELLEKIELLENDLITARNALTEKEAIIVRKDATISRLENDVSRLNTNSTQNQNTINNLNSQVASLNSHISTKSSEISNLRSQLTQKDYSISTLNSQIQNAQQGSFTMEDAPGNKICLRCVGFTGRIIGTMNTSDFSIVPG